MSNCEFRIADLREKRISNGGLWISDWDGGKKTFRMLDCGLRIGMAERKHFGCRIVDFGWGRKEFRISDVELRKNKCGIANVGW